VGRGAGSILCQLDCVPSSASWYIRTMKVITREKGEWKWGGGQVVFSVPVGLCAKLCQLVHQDYEGHNQRERRMEVGRLTGSSLCQLEWEPTSASWYISTMKVRTREKGEWKWGRGAGQSLSTYLHALQYFL
jgi:hypothetical protein